MGNQADPDKPTARIRSFTGQLGSTPEHITLTLTRAERHAIRAVAKRARQRVVTLDMTFRTTLTSHIPGDLSPVKATVTQLATFSVPAT